MHGAGGNNTMDGAGGNNPMFQGNINAHTRNNFNFGVQEVNIAERRGDDMVKEAALSSVVHVSLDKFFSDAENKIRPLFGIEKEKQKLVSNMSRITAQLQDAESRQVLDESGKLLNEIEEEDQRRKGGIGKKFRNFFSPLNPLYFRYRMGPKIRKLRKRLDVLAK